VFKAIELDRRIVIGVIIVVISISAVFLYMNLITDTGEPPISHEKPIKDFENVGGRYNATIIGFGDHYKVEYTDEDGKHIDGYFEDEMRSGLDWIKNYTPENATFLCWWDYGHMIKGYAERETVVRYPSEEIRESVANQSSIKGFDPYDKIFDVATALTATDLNVMLQIVEKYNVTHILVSGDDSSKAGWIFRAAELEPMDYLIFHDSEVEFNDEGMQTMIAKLLENRDTGLTLVHEDEEIKVYRAN